MGRCRFAGWLVAVIAVSGCLAAAAWVAQAEAGGWRFALAVAASAAALAASVHEARRSPTGGLAWDEGEWHRIGQGSTAGRLHPVLDLQRWLLVQWRPACGRVEWLWLERRRAPGDWDALRRAVYSPASTDATPGGADPVGAHAPRRPT